MHNIVTSDPRDHFWTRSDGRVFSSLYQEMMKGDDPRFAAWLADGSAENPHIPTPWPKNEAGVESDAILQDILRPYGVFITLGEYAKDSRWRRETGGITVDGIKVATDDRSKMLIAGAEAVAKDDPTFLTPFRDAGGEEHMLKADEVIAVAKAVRRHVAACFAAYSDVIAKIDAGTLKTRAKVDAAFAAV